MKRMLTHKYLLPSLSVIWIVIVGWHEFSLFDSSFGIYWQEGKHIISSGLFSVEPILTPEIGFNYFGHWLGSAFVYLTGTTGPPVLLQLVTLFSVAAIIIAIQLRQYRLEGNQLFTLLISILALPLLLNTYTLSHTFLLPLLVLSLIYVSLKINGIKNQVVGLVFIQLIWSNWHETSFLGILIVAILVGFSNKTIQQKSVLIGAIILATICNPLHLNIFSEYFYWIKIMVSEYLLPDATSNNGTIVNWLPYYHISIGLGSMLLILYNSLFNKASIARGVMLFLLLLIGLLNFEFSGITGLVLIVASYDSAVRFRERNGSLWISKKSPVIILILCSPLYFSSGVIFPFSSNWKLGIDEPSTKLVKFLKSKRLPKGAPFHNAGVASIMAYADTKNINPLFAPNQLYGEKKFNQTILDPSFEDFFQWVEVRNELASDLIVFRLLGASDESLQFLDSRLSDGEWTLIYHESLIVTILIRNSAENINLIRSLQQELP